MPTTSNFGWTTPADTDLVKDGAAAIRTLGNGIDTSLVDLKGGTTGQVLSKNSNTDLDYTWVTPNVGDITEVQAGTGISVASGTGPIPVVTNSMATEITAKGDLIVGTGSGTFDNLAVGTNGHTLVADSSTATGLKWAAPGGGKVLQVVSATYSTATTIATTTLTDTGLTASITPSATSSKILIIISQQVYQSANYRQLAGLSHRLFRGATEIYETGGTSDFSSQFFNGGNNSAAEICDVLPMVYLDSPNTTSSTTYKTQAKLSTTTNSSTSTFQLNSADSSIILMEIGV